MSKIGEHNYEKPDDSFEQVRHEIVRRVAEGRNPNPDLAHFDLIDLLLSIDEHACTDSYAMEVYVGQKVVKKVLVERSGVDWLKDHTIVKSVESRR